MLTKNEKMKCFYYKLNQKNMVIVVKSCTVKIYVQDMFTFLLLSNQLKLFM